MLGLKLPTDPRWTDIAKKNIKDILIDHAFCEQKAASTGISLIVCFPEYPELVNAMIELIREEISHFKMVHDKILARGWVLGKERRDDYVTQVQQFFPKGGSREDQLVHRLLYAALIEARSCERFKLLSEEIEDEELSKFYYDLMISEANHYTLFLKLARNYGEVNTVNKKWEELLDYEKNIMESLGNSEFIHG